MIEHDSSALGAIRPFLERLNGAPDVQILGGVGSVALRHPDLVIDFDARELRVPFIDLSVFRETGKKRDADIFVATSNGDRIKEVKALAQQTIEDGMEIAVCSVRSERAFRKQLPSFILPSGPFHSVTSERYETNGEGTEHMKILAPFGAAIDQSALEQWHIVAEDDEVVIPISHPGATIANYTQRSISGLRPKDKVKMDAAALNVFRVSPEVREWLIEGPGRSQLDLSVAFLSLRHPLDETVHLIDGIELPSMKWDELIDGPINLATQYPRYFRERAVGFAALKAKVAFAIESRLDLVDKLNNGTFERFMKPFVGNQ